MSNDLISRNALMQSLRNNVLIDVTPNLEQAIDEQPAVYDVDKVCRRISENKEMDNLIDAGYAIKNAKSGGIE